MEIDDIDIENSCGIQPAGVTYTDPGNDPNFVFVNDPSFETLVLYDIEGNVINVNSWIECAHYVNGGWDINQITGYRSEVVLFGIVSVLSLLFLIYKKSNFIKKYVKI